MTLNLFVHSVSYLSGTLKFYKEIRAEYLASVDENLAAEKGVFMTEYAKELDDENLRRNLALWGIVAAVSINIADNIIASKKIHYRKDKSLDLFLEPQFRQYMNLGARIKI